MKINKLVKLIEQITESQVSYIEIKTNNFYIKGIKDTSTQKNNEICYTTTNDTINDDIIQVKSIYVGIVCTINFKTNEYYVKTGQKVQFNQLLCLIYHLNLPIKIFSPTTGIVGKILVADKNMVEYGQVLFEIIQV